MMIKASKVKMSYKANRRLAPRYFGKFEGFGVNSQGKFAASNVGLFKYFQKHCAMAMECIPGLTTLQIINTSLGSTLVM